MLKKMSRSRPSEMELYQRTTFVGVIAWLSVCLIATGVYPELAAHLKKLWMTTGLVGLISSVGLLEVIKQDIERQGEIVSRHIRAAHTDPLTGIANRREFDERLARLMQESDWTTSPFCVLLADIDHFKNLNDTLGHQAGDEVLRSTSRILGSCLRNGDLVARYGGEEFVIVAPDVNLELAGRLAERLRTAVENQQALISNSPPKVTISIGLTLAEEGDTPESLLERADTALYRAKDTGRNRTCYWASPSCQPVVTLHDGLLPRRTPVGTGTLLSGTSRASFRHSPGMSSG